MNYWTPLNDDNDDKTDNNDEINVIQHSIHEDNSSGNKWTRRRERRQEQRIIIDSGAMSHFITEEMNLPKGQRSNKQVYLPDDTTLKTSTRTKLPFTNLLEAAREADILPGLKDHS